LVELAVAQRPCGGDEGDAIAEALHRARQDLAGGAHRPSVEANAAGRQAPFRARQKSRRPVVSPPAPVAHATSQLRAARRFCMLSSCTLSGPGHIHSYCSYCGSAFAAEQPWPRECAACGNITYRNPLPVAVAVVPV